MSRRFEIESSLLVSHGTLLIAVLVLLLTTDLRSANACNIPVFRYALERWSSDNLQLHLVIRDSQLRDSDRQAIEQLTQTTDSPTNLTTTVWDLDTSIELPEFLTNLKLSDKAEPWCLIRSSGDAEPPRVVWSSPLRDTTPQQLKTSPAREALVKMLLQGDSAVWIVIRGDDDRQADAMIRSLKTTLRQLEDETPLPDGIGLPGSELYSQIPLMVSFPILEVDAADTAERVFLEHLRAFLPGRPTTSSEAPATPAAPRSTLVVPVFGRGRALVAMTADDANPETIRDLTTFLSGACSCQVKRMNPGFDLLLSVDWKRQLFGESAADVPADSLLNGSDSGIPTLVAIAPGNAAAESIPPLVVVPSDVDTATGIDQQVGAATDTKAASDRRSAQQTQQFVWLTGGFAVLVGLGTLLSTLWRSA